MKNRRYSLSICAIFRDEAPYLGEWIEFHIKQGVEHFFLINDKSRDDFQDVLQPYRKANLVTVLNSKRWDQVFEYNRSLKKFGKRTKWMAFIDIDEFLFSPDGNKIKAVLDRLDDFSSVWVGWKVYGSSGLVEEPKEVVSSFLECVRWPSGEKEKADKVQLFQSLRGKTSLTGYPFNGKSIVKPEKIIEMGVHEPKNQTGDVLKDVSFQHLRINHYWSRSISHVHSKSTKPPIARKLREDKETPGNSAILWESHLNQSFDPIAHRLTNSNELPFVIFLGFNKTATKAIHAMMTKNGFPGVHWDRNKLVENMLKNRSRGRRLLSGYEDLRSFSDLTYVSDNFYFEGNSLFKELKRDYPDAFFVLNNRDTEKWIRSRMLHNGGLFATRHKQIRNLSSFEQLAVEWRAEKIRHEKLVRDYFKDDNHFLEFDIDDETVCAQVGKLLKVDLDCSRLERVGETPKESMR